MGQRLREMTLAHARGAVEQHVLVPLDELARGEVEELGLVQGGVEAEVELMWTST
jgi:hypothetical protein